MIVLSCERCGEVVVPVFVNTVIKACYGPGAHLLTWDGQLWLPHVSPRRPRR
jgi:hypothetical protein